MIGTLSSTMFLGFMCIDWYIRIILDRDDNAFTLIDRLRFCSSNYYLRLLVFCGLLFGSIWANLFISFDTEPFLFSIVNAGTDDVYL